MKDQTRRDILKQLALGSLAIGGVTANSAHADASPLQGRVKHTVARWTYDELSLDQLCLLAKRIGFSAIDLTGPKEWDTLKKHGMYSSMCNGAEINLVDGWNHPKNHATLIHNYHEHIELVAKAGYKNLICFTGNRRGMDDETGLRNCVAGLKQILAKAEKLGVDIQLEVFNSKVDHKDYMADNSRFAIELCKRLDSPNFKILFDIYHMQISEGDIIHTITDNHQYFGHYHIAGVPHRNEPMDAQELNFPAIIRAILATGYQGYIGQEFNPTGKTDEERAIALEQAIRRCDV